MGSRPRVLGQGIHPPPCLVDPEGWIRLIDPQSAGITKQMLADCSSFLLRCQEFRNMVQNFYRITAIVSDRVNEERSKALKSRMELESASREKARLEFLIHEREERLSRLQVYQSAIAVRAEELSHITQRLEGWSLGNQ